jgi:hypothetical protein
VHLEAPFFAKVLAPELCAHSRFGPQSAKDEIDQLMALQV